MNTLGAVMFVHNGIEFDYNFQETIENMKAFADQIVILDAGSTDGTDAVCRNLADFNTKVVCLSEEEWLAQKGKEKLSYFQNVAKSHLETDYYMVIQADEILHERSFRYVREAVNSGLPAFMCTRHNLWFNPWYKLNVEQGRKPCSTEVIRLAHREFNSIGDGESFDCPNVCFDLMNQIEIFHMGFVRKADIMKAKVIHIQEEVFRTPHDVRLDKAPVFDPWEYFRRTDVVPIDGELPRFIQKWVQERYPNGPVL